MVDLTDLKAGWHLSPGLYVLAAIGLLSLITLTLLGPRRDSREPPYINSTIPLIGHAVNMMVRGQDYFRQLASKYQYPVFSLQMVTGRIYTVSSPDWVAAILRTHHRTISSTPLINGAMEHIFDMDNEAMHIIRHVEHGQKGLLEEGSAIMGEALAPGAHLEDMTRSVVFEEGKMVNTLAREGATQELNLWTWIRHNFSMASMKAIYGPQNPFALDPSLEQDHWTFDASAAMFMIAPMPSLTVRKADQARSRLFKAWEKWVDNGEYKNASHFIQQRAKFNLETYGISKKGYARGETSMTFGVLSNTIPTGFWLLCYIFSDPDLLSLIREEIDACITTTPASTGAKEKRTISLPALKTSCPLLLASFRETLRLVANFSNMRSVTADTLVTNPSTGETLLFKKDSLLQIASSILHSDPSVWGDDVETFNPSRFLPADYAKQLTPRGTPTATTATDEKRKIVDPASAPPIRSHNTSSGTIKTKTHPGSFRPFGSHGHMCLGRHFAQSEILALAAVFVAGFEIVDRGQESEFTRPELPDWKTPMGAVVVHPTGEGCEVDVRRRTGYEGVEWGFEV